ncbi:MAG: fatty acid desaturase [Actinomycetota bacterium]|nr:fatty acid desaturase [Actinomycetota bacterium]
MTPETVLDGPRAPSPPIQRLPTRAEVRSIIPDDCFVRSTGRSLRYLAGSLAVVVALVAAAALFLPMTWAWLPVWVLYAVATGTAATGLWVIAHECGHRAFSPNQRLQDGIGFVLHSALLVPYFSWQRSHSVHHAKTNHLDEGETHVPSRAIDRDAESRRRGPIRANLATAWAITTALLVGWPAYLLVGTTGGPARGRTNHFWPVRPFSTALFPARWHARVWGSALGVLVVLVLLVAWALAAGSIAPVLALYVGPYLVVNAWLVTYTWLQHTDVDVAHYADPEWSWLRGAFQTVDRPYGRVVDLLHHRIGSTHVAHHIDHRIPHYHADRATEAIRAAFPEWYRFDPTPVPVALWRVGSECIAVQDHQIGWYFTDPAGSQDPTERPS